KVKVKNLLLSIGICIVFAVIGALLTGDALEGWFTQLIHPWFSLPIQAWYVVGVLYYLMAIIILTRILNRTQKPLGSKAFWLSIGMLAGNEFWNYLFFGLESTFLGFTSLIPFTILVFALFYELWKTDRMSAWILLPYAIWLGYDLV